MIFNLVFGLSKGYPPSIFSSVLTSPFIYKLICGNPQDLDDQDLQTLQFTASQINSFFRILHASGLWLNDGDRNLAVQCGKYFAEGFANLAASMAQQKLNLYRIRPKLHMFAELVVSMKLGRTGTINPLTSSCWSDEDFIGVVSQTSRSCHRGMTGLALSMSTLQKCLGRYRLQFSKLN